MAQHKSPGYDGLTSDVVCECWDFVGQDCVKLVQTIWRAGFNLHFIQIVQGFTREGPAKVHVNGGFTSDIRTGRGVRQGCPLAPLLFALCTEPFMRMMEEAEKAGGLKGAKVNLSKSLIMPFGCSEVPAWVRQSGCDVVGADMTFKYLGVRLGVHLGGNDSIQDAVRRLNSRILQWENFYLPWTARLVLIKHMLSQIPTYIMLAVGCDKKDANRLEQYCSQFLWGVNDQGRPKTPLIAWKRLIRPKAQGKVEKRCWGAEMTLLLLPTFCVKEAPTLDSLLKIWSRFRKNLRFECASELPEDLHVQSLKRISVIMGKPDDVEFRRIEETARKQKITQLKDVCSLNKDILVPQLCVDDTIMRPITWSGAQIREWLSSIKLTVTPLHHCASWLWLEGRRVGTKWQLPNSEWLKLIAGQVNLYNGISRHWEVEAEREEWRKRWHLLWKGCALMVHRVWMWRIAQQGLPTLERAEKWGVTSGICK
ncbi:hypothetical protein R1sor_006119 [Riccia sorocarpa]|uniref:Reverse transcriptase domain-containing protein n=1 Tax=Riccia sorocarpa TaxID=122646 RepID=A0ABD3HM05_9MARC